MSVNACWDSSWYTLCFLLPDRQHLLIWKHFFGFIHADADLRDHPDTGTGIWGGLSDGNPVQGETICPPFISGLRGHRDQNQPSCFSVVEQHAEISSEYRPVTLQKTCTNSVHLWVRLSVNLTYLLKGATVEGCRYAVAIQKRTQTSSPTLYPPLNPHWATCEGRFAVCVRKWWVITLLPISTRPPPNSDSLRSGQIFFEWICETWWMNSFICCSQAGAWFPLGLSWDLSPAGWTHPLLPLLLIECVS